MEDDEDDSNSETKSIEKWGIQGPKLTETDYIEIGEKIGESIEFSVEVEVTIFAHKRYKSFTGVIKSIEGQQGVLSMYVGYENIEINMNNIESVK